MRFPSPVEMIETPTTKPPKTNHNAVEWKPEKMICAGATSNNIATKKKSSAVMYSGIMPVARNAIVITARPAPFDISVLNPLIEPVKVGNNNSVPINNALDATSLES